MSEGRNACPWGTADVLLRTWRHLQEPTSAPRDWSCTWLGPQVPGSRHLRSFLAWWQAQQAFLSPPLARC